MRPAGREHPTQTMITSRVILSIALIGLAAILCCFVLDFKGELRGAMCFADLASACFATTTFMYSYLFIRQGNKSKP
jgi:hypothetical protein